MRPNILLPKLESWLRSAGLRRKGAWREVYHRFGADQTGYALPKDVLAASPEEYVTELQLAVEPQETSGEQ